MKWMSRYRYAGLEPERTWIEEFDAQTATLLARKTNDELLEP